MPINNIKGLEGLPGLYELDEETRNKFLLDNAEKLKQFRGNPGSFARAASNLYDNQKFASVFGEDAFYQLNNGTKEARELRNSMLRSKIINDAFDDRYSPYSRNEETGVITKDKTKGLGDEYDKFAQMPDESKLELLQSNYRSPEEFEKDWEERKNSIDKKFGIKGFGNGHEVMDAISLASPIPRALSYQSTGDTFADILASFGNEEGAKQRLKEKNDRIKDRIYSEAGKKEAYKLPNEVSSARMNPEIVGANEEDTRAKFKEAVTPNLEEGNWGISEYAKYYLNDEWDKSATMKDFSTEDMKNVLAKKYVYDRYLSPEMSATVLNDEAKEYQHDHQRFGTKFGLWARDVGISSLTYTADKFNGWKNIVLDAQDKLGDLPKVYVDDQNNILDPSSVVQYSDGKLGYVDDNGISHPVHLQEIPRTTLYNMGRNMDGTKDNSWINPEYLTKAEQFGTFDREEQDYYASLGTSPFKVAYNPNEDRDLLYESFKMMSFGLADGAAMLLPYGIGFAGKALSGANNAGKVVQGIGKGLEGIAAIAGTSKGGQMFQGLSGAVGIGYAYQRGAFQETLAQSMAELEQSLVDRSRNDINKQYTENAAYKAQVDALINNTAANLKANYLANADSNVNNLDEAALNDLVIKQAREAVLSDLTRDRMEQIKSTDEYAEMQKQAINSAGSAALNSFYPEAIKYGIVNTIGFRKYLYQHPTSLMKGASKNFKGLEEVTTAAGKKRLKVNSKFTTTGDKWKQLGKAAVGQVWGGAWTNGSDDMMVDAAERVATDRFHNYLNAFENGEAIADVYGGLEWINSYWKGLGNSLGQQTTWEAAAVGGLGSLVSATPHFANIASLATKQGREAYNRTFNKRALRDAEGNLRRDEKGNVIYEDINDVGGKFGFFIQNGLLNTYYGAMQNERELQEHADMVNGYLNQHKDFDDLVSLVASDIALDNAVGIGDKMSAKTQNFIKGIETIKALNLLGNSVKDPFTLSSVVRDRKALIDKAATMSLDPNDPNAFTEEEINNLLGQYYSQHKNLEKNEANNQIALEEISKNAQSLQEASKAYDKAIEQINKVEKNLGRTIGWGVKNQLIRSFALDSHWEGRINNMREEIGDNSDINGTPSDDVLLAVVGGKKNAEKLINTYDRQRDEINGFIDEQKQKVEAAKAELDKAEKGLKEAKDSDAKLIALAVYDEANRKWQSESLQQTFYEEYLTKTNQRQKELREALEKQKDAPDRVLTADEIFALDPISRARMLAPDDITVIKPDETNTPRFYSKEQRAEIDKLKKSLELKDPEALQKVQDIAALIRNRAANQDAYIRMSNNPEAAEESLSAQQYAHAVEAENLIYQQLADSHVAFIEHLDDSVTAHSDNSKDGVQRTVFNTLKKINDHILDIIDKTNALPQYQDQITKAKEWKSVYNDLEAVINGIDAPKGWKENIKNNIDGFVAESSTKEELLNSLEDAIDTVDNPNAAADINKILDGMVQLGYSRDATRLQDREERKKREADAKAKLEEENKRLEQQRKEIEARRKAAEAEAAKKAEEQAAQQKSAAENNPAEAKLVTEEPLEWGEESETKTEPEAQPVEQKDPVEFLIDYYSGTSGLKENDVVAQLDGTPYVKEHIKTGTDADGNPARGTVKGLNNETVEAALGKVIQERMPGYTVSEVSVATSQNLMTGDSKLLVVKDADGNEYGTPSNFIRGMAKRGQKFPASSQQTGETSVNTTTEGTDMQSGIVITQEDGGTTISSSDMTDEIASAVNNEHMDVATPQQEEGNETNISEDIENTYDNKSVLLSGNAMEKYQKEPLEDQGKLVPKGDKTKNDTRGKFDAWLEKKKIDLEGIISTELGRILATYPDIDIKFMSVNPAIHSEVTSHLFLVIDYTKDIEKFHNNDKYGGVIESDGKKYLIIGTVGYGDINDSRNKPRLALWDILYSKESKTKPLGLVVSHRKEFFNANANEQFFVDQTLSTQIPKGSITPGYRIKGLENDVEVGIERPLLELLEGEEKEVRNPNDLAFENLAFGIQKTPSLSGAPSFAVTRVRVENVMVPKNEEANVGRVFFLIRASNGKWLPIKIAPRKANDNEMRDGVLRQEVIGLLQRAFDYNASNTKESTKIRQDAIMELARIFYFDKERGISMWTDDSNTLKIIDRSLDSKKPKTKIYNLTESSQRDAFINDFFNEFNPLINLTLNKLINMQTNRSLLEKYSEAGALNTDVAALYTAGARYSIYGLNEDGKMIETPVEVTHSTDSNTRKLEKEVLYFGDSYIERDGQYYKRGSTTPIEDSELLTQLTYNSKIRDIVPSEAKNGKAWYILGTSENPEVVIRDENSKKVTPLSKEQSEQYIKQKREQEEALKRELNAETEQKQLEETELNWNDEEEGMQVGVEENEELNWNDEGETINNNKPQEKGENVNKEEAKPVEEEPTTFDSQTQPGFMSIEDFFNSPDHRSEVDSIFDIAEEKWKDLPDSIDEAVKFIKEKLGMAAIDTSEAGIKALKKTIEECR